MSSRKETKDKKAAKAEAVKQLKITLIRSPFKKLAMHRNNVKGLGLRKINSSVVIDATACNMGMVNNSAHMFRVEEVK